MTALFTRRAEQAAGEPLTVRVDARTVADPADYPELADGEATTLRRDGHLVTASGRPVAAVTSVYRPGLLNEYAPGTARLLARTCVPLGLALEPYGVERVELDAPAGQTRGLLMLNGRPVALTLERML